MPDGCGNNRPPSVATHYPGSTAEADVAGGETILVVDDEPQLQSLLAVMLVSQGYTVHSSPGPREALLFLESYTGPLSLLLTDIRMAVMNGPQLAERVRSGRPDTAILLMTGYPGDPADPDSALPVDIPVIQKPFTSAVLTKTVREVLSTRRSKWP